MAGRNGGAGGATRAPPWLRNPPKYFGNFRQNVSDFIDRFGTLRSPPRQSKFRDRNNPVYSRLWTIPLHFSDGSKQQGNSILLYVFEQHMVTDDAVTYCDNCRVAGWQSHPLCKRTYHFFVPVAKPEVNWRAGEAYIQAQLLENQTHLLHGALHVNGFGHLLRINGYEGGSLVLSGRQLMELWNNICTLLRARLVTVEDVSQKFAMPYRLLHGVAYKATWYGKWDYNFCRGPFNITEAEWTSAVERLHNIPVKQFAAELERHKIPFIVNVGQYSDKDQPPKILGELMRRVIKQANAKLMSSKGRDGLSSRGQGTKPKIKQNLSLNVDAADLKLKDFRFPSCRWSDNRLQLAAYVVLNTLKQANNGWMSRQDVRDAARQYIGDTGLLDFVLKVMGNQVVNGNLIRREFNASSRVLEYKLETTDGKATGPSLLPKITVNGTARDHKHKPASNAREDLKILYRALVHHAGHPNNENANGRTKHPPALSWQKDVGCVLDTKQFVRDYLGESLPEGKDIRNVPVLRLLVTVRLDHEHEPTLTRGNSSRNRVAVPHEVVLLHESSTLEQAKEMISHSFQELYVMLHGFKVDRIVSNGVGDKHLPDQAKLCQVKLGSTIQVTGGGVSSNKLHHHIGGLEDWVVSCVCGTKDDDGERMVECERCSVWVHTRCYGTPDTSPCPENFVCKNCRKHRRVESM